MITKCQMSFFLVIYVEKWEYLVSTGNLKEREPVAGYVDSMKEWVNHSQKIKLKKAQKTKFGVPWLSTSVACYVDK